MPPSRDLTTTAGWDILSADRYVMVVWIVHQLHCGCARSSGGQSGGFLNRFEAFS